MMPKYEDYQRMIYSKAWQWVRRNPNLEFDELVGWGNLAYAEAVKSWDPDKGKFSTHLWWQLRHRLGCLNSEVIEYDNATTDLDESFQVADPSSSDDSISFWSAIHGLSREAEEVINLILGTSGELCDFTMRSIKVTQGNLRKYLRSLSWPARKIDTAITEVKEMLKSL